MRKLIRWHEGKHFFYSTSLSSLTSVSVNLVGDFLRCARVHKQVQSSLVRIRGSRIETQRLRAFPRRPSSQIRANRGNTPPRFPFVWLSSLPSVATLSRSASIVDIITIAINVEYNRQVLLEKNQFPDKNVSLVAFAKVPITRNINDTNETVKYNSIK